MNINKNEIELGDICINVTYKNIKNVHLSVHPPHGRVTIAAPLSMNIETIRLFSISKLGWIRKKQTKLKNQNREPIREYNTRESHYYLGKRYLIKIVKHSAAARVILKHNVIELHVRPNSTKKQKKLLMQKWYRQKLKEIVLPYIKRLEKNINVNVSEISVRAMKTKWGTCIKEQRRICLNTELAKKSIEDIEYVLVHEMTHLLERNHNDNFIKYMYKFLPKWRHFREELNRSALGHVEWSY